MIAPFLVAVALIAADDPPIGLADLEAYKPALESRLDGSAPVVRFRDLWDQPKAFAGRVVTIEGRLARTFRQPKLGDFPPLVEAWVVSTAGDPFCVVYPMQSGTNSPEIGATVRFSGTFLRRVQYPAADTNRVVPLIVGPEPPSSLAMESSKDRWSWSSIDWMMGVVASVVIVAVLTRRHLDRPASRPIALDPDPVFDDGEPGAEGNPDEASR
jgi:hypothetical protein